MPALSPLSVVVAGVTDHAVEQYRLRFLAGRKNARSHASDDDIRETILKSITLAVPVEIPARFKVQSLLANDGVPAVYLWNGSRQIMFVVSLDGSVLTCYPMAKWRLSERKHGLSSSSGWPPRRLNGRSAARTFDPPPESRDDDLDDDDDGGEYVQSPKRKYRRVRRVEIDSDV